MHMPDLAVTMLACWLHHADEGCLLTWAYARPTFDSIMDLYIALRQSRRQEGRGMHAHLLVSQVHPLYCISDLVSSTV